MYIDFHTHILHNIDDGAKDIAMSLAMIESCYKTGAETTILTPHIEATADYESFLQTREKRFSELSSAVKDNGIPHPEFLLGAEVLLDGSLSEREDVRSLCIEGTELILIELPYTSWNSWYNNEIYSLMSKHDVTPVMAHIERYLRSPDDIRKLEHFISFGVKFQINASSFLSFSGRRIIRELAAAGNIHAIGSDAHNMFRRTPDISKALKSLENKFGSDFIEHIYKKTLTLLGDAI